MKKGFKKFGAVLLTVAMTLTMNLTALAAPDGTLENGLDGDFTNDAWVVDANETVNIQKELYSDNADDSNVNAPTFNYDYAIAAATGGNTITDATSAHASGVSVTITTKPGVTNGLKVNNASGTTGSITWDPDSDLLTEGSNIKNLALDFSGVVFGAAGVYRYVITETPDTYADAGVTETTGTHVRYLDVYVKPTASGFTDGTSADDWDVYGYVCFSNDNSIDATDTSGSEPDVAAAVKTNGFVSGTGVDPDIYYTFNVVISKTVAGDSLLMSTHAEFPFKATFANSTVTEPVLPIVTASNSYATVTDTVTSGDINALVNHGTTIGHGGDITYTGIPSGTSVSVNETITATGTAGTTYNVTTTGADTNLNEVVANPNSSTSAVLNAQTALQANNSADIAFTNTLQLISPTGFIVRFAPYMLVLMGGIFLIVLGVVLYKRTNKEEA